MRGVVYANVSYKHWFTFFIICKAIFLILLTVSIGIDWVFINSIALPIIYKPNTDSLNFTSSDYFDPSSFKGDLLKCNQGCQKHYSDEKSDWCNIEHYYLITNSTTPQNLNTYHSLCQLFQRLNNSGVYYLICIAIALLFLVLWVLNLIKIYLHADYLYHSICVGMCYLIMFIVAYVGYLKMVPLKFYHNCPAFPIDGRVPNVCAAGANITVLIAFIASIAYFKCFWWVKHNTIKRYRNSPQFNENIQASNAYQNNPVSLRQNNVPQTNTNLAMNSPYPIYQYSQPPMNVNGAKNSAFPIYQSPQVDPPNNGPYSSYQLPPPNVNANDPVAISIDPPGFINDALYYPPNGIAKIEEYSQPDIRDENPNKSPSSSSSSNELEERQSS